MRLKITIAYKTPSGRFSLYEDTVYSNDLGIGIDTVKRWLLNDPKRKVGEILSWNVEQLI